MRLLIDMNLSPAWVPYLQAAGHEAEHWAEVGRADAPDEALLAHARERGAILLTHDLDFGAILAATRGVAPSVLQLRAERLSPAVNGAAILAALSQLERELAAGALVSVEPGRLRIAMLPLR